MRQTIIKNTILCGVQAVVLLTSSVAYASDDTAGVKNLFEQMNSRFASLTSLSYTVTRTTVSGTKSIEEKWDFRLKAPGSMKIEYYTPAHRIIIVNETNMWEYIPFAKKALQTELAAMPEETKLKTVSSMMSHVAVDGLRLGDYSKMLQRITRTTRGKDNISIIEGQNPRFVVHVDIEKKALLHSELYDDNGELTIQTDASGFIKLATGFWFPQNITAIYRTKTGAVKSTIVIANARINENLADEIFQFSAPEGVHVTKR